MTFLLLLLLFQTLQIEAIFFVKLYALFCVVPPPWCLDTWKNIIINEYYQWDLASLSQPTWNKKRGKNTSKQTISCHALA